MYLCVDDDIPFLSLENITGMLRLSFFFFFLEYILSFIDDFYLRLEAILNQIFNCPEATCP